MSLEVLLNERRRHSRAISKIDREVWELLKIKRHAIYKKLGKKTYGVLKARLYERKTLEEVGKEFGVTRERIRQIEHKGIFFIDRL